MAITFELSENYLDDDGLPVISISVKSDIVGSIVVNWRLASETSEVPGDAGYINYQVVDSSVSYDITEYGGNPLAYNTSYVINVRYSGSQPEGSGITVTTLPQETDSVFFSITKITSSSVSVHVEDFSPGYPSGYRPWRARIDLIKDGTSSKKGWVDFSGGEADISVTGLTRKSLYTIKVQYQLGKEEDGYIYYGATKYADPRNGYEIETKGGGVHIYTNEWKNASVWIYCTVDGVTDWYEAIPYIYTSNRWKQTI